MSNDEITAKMLYQIFEKNTSIYRKAILDIYHGLYAPDDKPDYKLDDVPLSAWLDMMVCIAMEEENESQRILD